METFEYRILEELKKINDRLDKLESQPFGPLQPYTPKVKPPVSFCSKCGLKLEGVMGYCCPRPDCGCGMGPIMCCSNKTQ